MKYATALSTALFIAGTAVQPAEASVGGGAGVIGDLMKKIFEIIFQIEGPPRRDTMYPVLENRQTPPGVPEFEYQRCSDDITGKTITVAADGANIQFSGVPATCMNLANVLIGDPVNGPYALPCGSDCLSYSNLSPAQYDQLMAVLSG